MASIDRYRPPGRETYQPPTRPGNSNQTASAHSGRPSKSPSKRREVPPAVPSPPPLYSRNSPPASARPQSRRTASPARNAANESARRGTASGAAVSQWFFTQEEVNSSPSVLDGLSPAEERLRRAKGINFIYQAGILLDLPQITLYVAGVFFHRFYMRCSMVEEKGGIHHYNIAATALFLANKTEENCRKTRDIIVSVARVAQKNAKLIIDEQSKEYWRWRDSILMHEEVMLEKLTFDVSIQNPHNELYKVLERLGVIHNKHLRHAAWAFCNDACLTSLPLLMDGYDIAVASIFFSSTFTKQPISDINGEPWWKSLNSNEPLMIKAIDTLREFYTENPLRKQENPYQGSPEFSLENTRKLGEGSSTGATPRTDTQSPRPNGGDIPAGNKDQDMTSTTAMEEASQLAPGDSDALLKEAANDPANHPSTNSSRGLVSPSKRREVESLASEAREQKRRRMSSDDEGEVLE
ncbi:cyclin-like protein [Xylariales sp. PMI_506]|nr:cyclin-like protein [Xylariales sp. PMI_506]